MKLCKPCDTKLFNGADSCGICGNKDLILLSSPEPKIKYDEKGEVDEIFDDPTQEEMKEIIQEEDKREYDKRIKRGASYLSRTSSPTLGQNPNNPSVTHWANPSTPTRIAHCPNCMQIVNTNTSGRYCSACHKDYAEKNYNNDLNGRRRHGERRVRTP